MKLDLRRLLFGAVPGIKRLTPGGPLILEPLTLTIMASFNRDDIMESALIDEGLRRLVARALRRQVRSIRDLVDGAVLYGRTWNMASKEAPLVEVPKLTDIEFDKKNRLIITGRAKVRASPDQPSIENSFKLRTRLGTRENGQYIRLKDPELALVVECPSAWERNIVSICKKFNLPIPTRPDPIYTFFPLVSPLKKTEQDGFNLGEDNTINSIFIQNGALRFEISAVLRPGRFLGNHYLAFTVPNRTFIITLERVKEGIREARRNKKRLKQAKKRSVVSNSNEAEEMYLNGDNISINNEINNIEGDWNETSDNDANIPNSVIGNRPGFFGRFLEGYLEAARDDLKEERNEQLTTAISEYFGGSDEETEES